MHSRNSWTKDRPARARIVCREKGHVQWFPEPCVVGNATTRAVFMVQACDAFDSAFCIVGVFCVQHVFIGFICFCALCILCVICRDWFVCLCALCIRCVICQCMYVCLCIFVLFSFFFVFFFVFQCLRVSVSYFLVVSLLFFLSSFSLLPWVRGLILFRLRARACACACVVPVFLIFRSIYLLSLSSVVCVFPIFRSIYLFSHICVLGGRVPAICLQCVAQVFCTFVHMCCWFWVSVGAWSLSVFLLRHHKLEKSIAEHQVEIIEDWICIYQHRWKRRQISDYNALNAISSDKCARKNKIKGAWICWPCSLKTCRTRSRPRRLRMRWKRRKKSSSSMRLRWINREIERGVDGEEGHIGRDNC